MERIKEMDSSVLNYNRNGLNHTWNNDNGVRIHIPGIPTRGQGTDKEPISDATAVGVMGIGFLIIGLILL